MESRFKRILERIIREDRSIQKDYEDITIYSLPHTQNETGTGRKTATGIFGRTYPELKIEHGRRNRFYNQKSIFGNIDHDLINENDIVRRYSIPADTPSRSSGVNYLSLEKVVIKSIFNPLLSRVRETADFIIQTGTCIGGIQRSLIKFSPIIYYEPVREMMTDLCEKTLLEESLRERDEIYKSGKNYIQNLFNALRLPGTPILPGEGRIGLKSVFIDRETNKISIGFPASRMESFSLAYESAASFIISLERLEEKLPFSGKRISFFKKSFLDGLGLENFVDKRLFALGYLRLVLSDLAPSFGDRKKDRSYYAWKKTVLKRLNIIFKTDKGFLPDPAALTGVYSSLRW